QHRHHQPDREPAHRGEDRKATGGMNRHPDHTTVWTQGRNPRHRWRGMARRTLLTATITTVAAGALVAPPVNAEPADPPRASLSVATYNVCKVSCMGGRFTWATRRKAIARTVAAADPAVLAVQEAPTLPWRG